ncbi:MAG: ABC transporter permease, partial [Rhodothermales bacterium]|nr:ABC transporter permease [Rhodothermales bacterium]
MLKNYLVVALRSLWKQRGFAFINVVGLAVGLAFCALIALYVQDEWTYDRFHEKGDRIVRVHRATFAPDGSVESTDVYLPMPLGPALERDLPAVEATVRFREVDHLVRPAGEREAVREASVLYADPSLFHVFTFPLRRGDPGGVLSRLHSAVLTPQQAAAFFGEADPIGQTLQVRIDDAFVDFTVTGIAEPPPSNSTIQFGIVLPFAAWAAYVPWARERAESWQSSAYITYALLREGAPALDAETLLAFRRTYYPDEEVRWREDWGWTADLVPVRYRAQPLYDIHLDPAVGGGLTPPSDPFYAALLAAIAFGVLGIACINFMTLAVGRSARRAREVGVRKAIGARRTQ